MHTCPADLVRCPRNQPAPAPWQLPASNLPPARASPADQMGNELLLLLHHAELLHAGTGHDH